MDMKIENYVAKKQRTGTNYYGMVYFKEEQK